MVKRSLLILMMAACGKFEDPAIVLDLRPILVGAIQPEQIVTADAMTQPADILAQLQDTLVVVWLSDLNFDRRIRWSAEVCNLDDASRCDHDTPYESLGSGVWDDPDMLSGLPFFKIPADGNLLGILVDELQNDPLHGLGGITFGISMKFGGEDADPALDQYLSKEMMVSPAIPAGRTPNRNPDIDSISTEIDGGDDFPLVYTNCDTNMALVLKPGQKVRMEPIENADTREVYTVPALDGTTRTFTESVTYQWLATAGKFSDSTTGGGHDPFGNLMPVHTEWTAPSADKLDGPTDVRLWVVIRDERLGVSWRYTCLRVVP